ncbi:hypothetical protein BGY98DRAFT_1021249 [Russula aff. rugulosa BPL654]|nr:hypothetical protein BGY98DRAFT_1021249 [Russula aff. rugulosa BPL654]
MLRQNQRPQDAGCMCTDDGPYGMATYCRSPCTTCWSHCGMPRTPHHRHRCWCRPQSPYY